MSYHSYYKKEQLQKLYKGVVNDSDFIIEDICNRRNENPVAHISGELVEKDIFNVIIESDISTLEELFNKKMENIV